MGVTLLGLVPHYLKDWDPYTQIQDENHVRYCFLLYEGVIEDQIQVEINADNNTLELCYKFGDSSRVKTFKKQLPHGNYHKVDKKVYIDKDHRLFFIDLSGFKINVSDDQTESNHKVLTLTSSTLVALFYTLNLKFTFFFSFPPIHWKVLGRKDSIKFLTLPSFSTHHSLSCFNTFVNTHSFPSMLDVCVLCCAKLTHYVHWFQS